MQAPPSPTPRSSGTHSGSAYARRSLDVFATLRMHWLACLLIFGATAVGLGLLAKQNEQFVYTSSAAIRVSRTFPRTLQNDRELDLNSTWDYDSFRNDQVALLLRSDVLRDALVLCSQMGPPWGLDDAPESEIVLGFANSLLITAVPKSTRIEIILQSVDRDALRPALNALLEAFNAAHRREYFFTEDARPETLRSALITVETSIAAKRKEIETLATALGVTGFAVGSQNPWQSQLDSARETLGRAQLATREAAVYRETLRATVEVSQHPAQLLAGEVEWGELSTGLREILAPLTLRYAEVLSELNALGEGHPGRPILLRERESIEQQVTKIRASQVEDLVRAADDAVRQTRASEEASRLTVSELQTRNSEYISGFQRGRALEDDLPVDMSLRDRLKQRLEFFEFETQSPSYAEIVQNATEVDPVGTSRLKRDLALAVFLALLLALGLPVLWDLRDERVHTPEDVRRALGFPLAGWLPKASRVGSNKLHLAQIQRLAQALDRDRKSHGARLLVFTGVKARSTLSLVRAIGESLCDLGRRVLVVDAIGGAPGEHAGNTGLLGLLAGDPLQVIPTQDDGDFLPRGTAAGGVADWDAWAQILSNAAATYELILVAGPPLLTAPAAEMLVTEADLSVLVVEAENELLGEVSRAGQILQSLRPKAVGSVLTNIRAFRSRGYYRNLN